jgi:hypothetical protein
MYISAFQGDAMSTRWTLVVSEETDRALRAFLGMSGAKKGDLSAFVEEAVKERLFELTVERIKNRNASADQDDLIRIIDSAVMAARAPGP